MKLTPQQQMVMEYVKEWGRIVPAKMGGRTYQGRMWGSETSKRCRELRAMNLLEGQRVGRFEVFFPKERAMSELLSQMNPGSIQPTLINQ